MSEETPEPSHQDPAEPNEIGTEVETTEQPEPVVPVEPQSTPVEPEPAPVEKEPAETDTPNPDAKIHNSHGNDYQVTPEAGYRKIS